MVEIEQRTVVVNHPISCNLWRAPNGEKGDCDCGALRRYFESEAFHDMKLETTGDVGKCRDPDCRICAMERLGITEQDIAETMPPEGER